MSNIVTRNSALPSVERARELLSSTNTIDDVKKIRAIAMAVATVERGKEIACDAGEIIVLADTRRAQLEAEEKKGKGIQRSDVPIPKSDLMSESRRVPLLSLPDEDRSKYFAQCRKALVPPTTTGASALAKLEPKLRAKAIAKLDDEKAHVPTAIREVAREQEKEKLEDIVAKEVKAASGLYDVIVLDPPWPMEKIERDCTPTQVSFDYPTMSEEEMSVMKVPCADDCHVWVWTTSKFLPMCLRLIESWGLTYGGLFAWHKPGGFQPFGQWQYNLEPIVYARRGNPKFFDTKAFNACFQAPRGKHSEKPEEFYDVIRRVTAGRRLDMFNRREIKEFDRWGNEA